MSIVIQKAANSVDPLEEFPAIGLFELCASAELLSRVDRKYFVEPEHMRRLLDFLASQEAHVLEIDHSRSFTYVSDYFDTENLTLYREAATGRRRRFKLRTRTYADSGLHFLELKTRGPRNSNVKDRFSLPRLSEEECVSLVGRNADEEPSAVELRGAPLYSDPAAFQWWGKCLQNAQWYPIRLRRWR